MQLWLCLFVCLFTSMYCSILYCELLSTANTTFSLNGKMDKQFCLCKYAIACATIGVKKHQFSEALKMCVPTWIVIYGPPSCAQLELHSCLNKCTLLLRLCDWVWISWIFSHGNWPIFTVRHLTTASVEKMEIPSGSSSAGKWRMSPAINHTATLTDRLAP